MPYTPDNAVVWTEIPVRDLDAAVAFYNAVFDSGLEIENGGPNDVAFFKTSEPNGVAGHLYPGAPAAPGTGSTIHLQVPDTIEAALERVEKAGGSVQPGILPLPSGRFAYARDLDGNSIGLYQPNAA